MHLIAYTSEYCGPAEIDIQLADIVEKSRRNNSERDITGVMFQHNGRFLQFLEGEESTVRALIEKIERDDRHSKFQMLFDDPVLERSFPEWSMDCFNLTGERSIDLQHLEMLVAALRSNFEVQSASFVADMFKDAIELDWLRKEEFALAD